MNRLEAMQIYLRVAELASFTQAANQLGLPKATVSNAIRELENSLGTRLLQRTTRTVRMTQDGMVYYERAKDMLADMEELNTLFQQSEADISGRLRVDLPLAIARHIVIPRLPEWLDELPRLHVEISTTDRRVDVIREGFDCVVRIGAPGDLSLIARPLGELRQINVASPAYLARFGTPQHLPDLANHRLIHYAQTFGSQPTGFEYTEGNQVQRIAMEGVMTVNNSDAYQAACLAGFGLIQAPEPGLREHLAAGRLVQLLPGWTPPPMPVSLLYPNRRHLPKRTQRFMQWLTAVVQDYLRR